MTHDADEGQTGKVPDETREKLRDLREDPYSAPFDYAAVPDGPDTAPTGEEVERRLKDKGLAGYFDANHRFSTGSLDERRWKLSDIEARYCWWCGNPMPQKLFIACEFGGLPMPDCGCSGCQRNRDAAKHRERGVGNPPLACSQECKRERSNEIRRWNTAVKRAEKLGLEPPPEPQRRPPAWTPEDLNRLEVMAFNFDQQRKADEEYRKNPPGPRRLPYPLPGQLRGIPPERMPHS